VSDPLCDSANSIAAIAYRKWQELRSRSIWSGEEVDEEARFQDFHSSPTRFYAPPELPVTRLEWNEERAAARYEAELKRKRQQAENFMQSDGLKMGKRRIRIMTKTTSASDSNHSMHPEEDAASPPEAFKRKVTRDIATRPCSRCRRIKQKCDRVNPCGRCVRAGAPCDVAELNADNENWLNNYQSLTQNACSTDLPS
jgi:hypothetical protein